MCVCVCVCVCVCIFICAYPTQLIYLGVCLSYTHFPRFFTEFKESRLDLPRLSQ